MKKLLFGLILVSFLSTACTDQQIHRPATIQGKAVSILKGGLQSRDPKMRTHAIEISAETGQKDMIGLITELTTDPVVPVRFAATVGLGDMQCLRCEKILRKSLNDPDVNVRIGAAYSLAKLNYPKYVEQIRAAAKSPDQTVRANAALLLGKLGNPKNIDLLYEVMEEPDSIDKVRMQAVESIARLGDERMYRSKLWALQISKFADDRVMGIRGMGALNTAESRNAITMMLQDEVLEVRLAAAEQLARLGDKRGKEEVLGYFQTSPDLNRPDMANGMAVMAIGHLKSDRLNAFLPQALNSNNPYIQLLAAQSVLIEKSQLPPTRTPIPNISTGTGFSVCENGYIVTAYHIVEGAKSIQVKFPSGKWIPAQVIKKSQINDIAILKTDTTLPNVLVLTDEMKQGQKVFTIGYPVTDLLGVEPKYTDGSISSLTGLSDEAAFMQISVPTQPGNSGGPLMNETGQVVGMVTSKAAIEYFYNRTGTLPENVNWAIKSPFIKLLMPQDCASYGMPEKTDIVELARKAVCLIKAESQY